MNGGVAGWQDADLVKTGRMTAGQATADVAVQTGVGLAAGASGAAAGAAVGSVVPVVGTAAGAVVGFGVGVGASYVAQHSAALHRAEHAAGDYLTAHFEKPLQQAWHPVTEAVDATRSAGLARRGRGRCPGDEGAARARQCRGERTRSGPRRDGEAGRPVRRIRAARRRAAVGRGLLARPVVATGTGVRRPGRRSWSFGLGPCEGTGARAWARAGPDGRRGGTRDDRASSMTASIGDGDRPGTGAGVRGLTDAVITAVNREGSDLVVHLEGGVRSKLRRMDGTLVFVAAGPVESTDLRNAAIDRPLEAGWKVDRLSVATDAATLEVRRDDGMGDAAVVAHRIPCAGRSRPPPAKPRQGDPGAAPKLEQPIWTGPRCGPVHIRQVALSTKFSSTTFSPTDVGLTERALVVTTARPMQPTRSRPVAAVRRRPRPPGAAARPVWSPRGRIGSLIAPRREGDVRGLDRHRLQLAAWSGMGDPRRAIARPHEHAVARDDGRPDLRGHRRHPLGGRPYMPPMPRDVSRTLRPPPVRDRPQPAGEPVRPVRRRETTHEPTDDVTHDQTFCRSDRWTRRVQANRERPARPSCEMDAIASSSARLAVMAGSARLDDPGNRGSVRISAYSCDSTARNAISDVVACDVTEWDDDVMPADAARAERFPPRRRGPPCPIAVRA